MSTTPIIDQHAAQLMAQYTERKESYDTLLSVVGQLLGDRLAESKVPVTSLTMRVKESGSLEKKIAKKGHKYQSLDDITDILGVRIITLYSEDVDKVAALVEQLFDIDWNDSVDKRKMHDVNNFGYLSLHYICRLPESLYSRADQPLLNTIRFEIQMRSTLQHMWAEVEHDIRYKTSVQIPTAYSREFGRLAGMLELIDDEFCRIRQHMTDYRRRMTEMVSHGALDDIQLNLESWNTYLKTEPLADIDRKIQAINQGEIIAVPLARYVDIMHNLGLVTLGDVDRMIRRNTDNAIHVIRYKMSHTDLDIISSATGLQMLLIVEVLTTDDSRLKLASLLHDMYGDAGYSEKMVDEFLAIKKKIMRI